MLARSIGKKYGLIGDKGLSSGFISVQNFYMELILNFQLAFKCFIIFNSKKYLTYYR
jgi:hypothetical protein